MTFVLWDSWRLAPGAIALLGEHAIAVPCHRTWGSESTNATSFAALTAFTR
ncbi:hypothetical protein JJD41_12750 [Oxynema sp. CENA135]|uniref:hypothetical protein n=1 Tax=Oxynema sp. CENA135 TaxID=984206 RepID=UPI00190A81ED|nr:hypothetical protein [Oxynema sp. CENA135]MBK4730726.1 hypothetical protein [Oxynema sp. CENA135]